MLKDIFLRFAYDLRAATQNIITCWGDNFDFFDFDTEQDWTTTKKLWRFFSLADKSSGI